MGISASVVDGRVVSSTTSTTEKGTVIKDSRGNGAMDKDAFLNLLVTQMKYQDPLEPTSNTEYVSQFAQFSELEEMQNLSGSMDVSRASSLVGEYVTVKTKNAVTGEESLIGGKVDYVAMEGGKAYLNINGQNYSIDDLDTVVDEQYLTAYNLATDFTKSLKELPTLENLTPSYREIIENLRTVYDDMTPYQKSFISEAQISDLEKYEKQLQMIG